MINYWTAHFKNKKINDLKLLYEGRYSANSNTELGKFMSKADRGVMEHINKYLFGGSNRKYKSNQRSNRKYKSNQKYNR